jgi:hypothetical protein
VIAPLVVAPPVLAGAAAATLILRRAWRDRARDRPLLIAAGWGLFALATALGMAVVGPVPGFVEAVALGSVGAIAIVWAGATRKAPRAPRDRASLAPEPLDGPSRAWRGVLKALLCGPLGMTAAMGVAFAYAVWAPGAVQTRLLIAALLVPGLWGLAMTWTLADQRLIRALAVLVGTSVVGFGLAFLGRLA